MPRWWRSGNDRAGSSAKRWVVVDVETSGLDMDHDELIAIAAVAVHFDDADEGTRLPRIALVDSFESVLRREVPGADKDNILLHGIGVGAQRAGAPPREVLAAFEAWAGAAPLVAYHAMFDQAMIARAAKAHLGRPWRHAWLDLAPVAAGLCPHVKAQALDEWLDHFGIPCAVRHQAAADALATAELLLRLWPQARAQRCETFTALQRLAQDQRWLGAR